MIDNSIAIMNMEMRLPFDIISQLLDILEQICPKTLLNFALTSKAIYAIAEGFLHRTLCIVGKKSDKAYPLRRDTYTAHLQELFFRPWTITSSLYYSPVYDGIMELLSDFLPKCRRLKRLRWGPGRAIPKSILDSLVELSPQVQLDYEILGVFDTNVALSDLRFNPTLVSLAIRLSELHFEAFSELQVAAYSCPNLRRLSIMLDHNDNDLSLQWKNVTNRRLSLDTLHLNGCCSDQTGIIDLAGMTDMSKLRHLSMLNISSMPELDCVDIRSLQVVLHDQQLDSLDYLVEFLFRCTCMEDLDLTGAASRMDTALLHHLGNSLKSLRLHEYESRSGPLLRYTLTDDQIAALAIHCPCLDVLGLDIEYQGKWPYSTLDRISRSFWSLIKLELYLEINIANPDEPLQPAATYTSVSHLWDYTWSSMKQARKSHPEVCTDPRLRELTVVAGSFRSYIPAGPFTWEQTQQQRFRAAALENQQQHGSAHVTCLEVENILNGMDDGDLETAKRRAANGASNCPQPDYMAYLIRMARNAPTPGD